MDISAITITDDAAPMHVKHPAHDYPLYHGEGADADGRKTGDDASPTTINVRSLDSDLVREAMREGDRAGMKSGEKGSDDLIDAVVAGWDGFTEGGEPMEATRANKIKLMRANPAIDRQVFAFARDQANFFGNAAKN